MNSVKFDPTQLDKDWLKEIIEEKDAHRHQVNGAMVAEITSDVFVLKDGVGVAASGLGEGSLNLLDFSGFAAPTLSLATAAIIIRSIYKQMGKVANDQQILEALYEMDEDTPQDIIEGVRDYIRLLHDTDGEDAEQSNPTLEVKTIDPKALMAIRSGVRAGSENKSLISKVFNAVSFVVKESKSAFRLMFETARDWQDLKDTTAIAARNSMEVFGNWRSIREHSKEPTIYEMHKRKQSRSFADKSGEDAVSMRDIFSKEQRANMLLLHHEESAMRNISAARISNAIGLTACSTVIGLATMMGLYNIVTGNLGMVPASIYTVVASLPSFKAITNELDSLTKTDKKYAPIVENAGREYYRGIAPGLERS